MLGSQGKTLNIHCVSGRGSSFSEFLQQKASLENEIAGERRDLGFADLNMTNLPQNNIIK